MLRSSVRRNHSDAKEVYVDIFLMLPFVMHATRCRARQVQFNRRFFGKPLLNMGFSRRFQQMEVKNLAAAVPASCVEPARAWNTVYLVDYFASYEIVKDSDCAAVGERDVRHIRGAGAQPIME